jgi:two-component system chemotaxis response regulator CheY
MTTHSCLIVEDSPVMRQQLVFALARVGGIDVSEVDDGIHALKALAARRFDLVITDINMPIMDGLKLVRRLRAEPLHQGVPVIVVTTEGAGDDRERALALGANAYLVKPVQAAELVTLVRELLGLR